jgi:hypothetical protein
MEIKEFDVDVSKLEIMEVNGFDFEFGFKVKTETIDVPKNILSIQEKDIKFYYLSRVINGFKSPFMLKKGDSNYWIGTDNFLYVPNKENKLVIAEFDFGNGMVQLKWKLSKSEYKKESKKA